MAKLISVFYYLSLLFVINLDGDPVLDVWIDEEQFHSDDLSHNLQRQRRAADSTIFEYDIILMVDVETSQIRDVKALLDNMFSEITTSDNSANITSANVTTVCNETACSCEDGFYWNSQTCSSYSCYSVTMGETCNCIKNTSVDGICDVIPTAAPPASTLLTLITSTSPTSKTEESKGASTTTTSTMTQHISRTMATTTATTQTTVTTSSTTTKPTTLTTATTSTTTPQISRTMATTTATTQTTVTTSSTTKPTTLTTTTSQTTVTTSSTTKPTTLTTTTKQTITSTMTTTAKATTRSSTPEKAIQTNMYFVINDDFSDDLNDKSSDKYKSYASIINQKLNEAYRNHLPGFQTAYVTGFSKGSIRTDFIFISDEPTVDQIMAANTELKESLKSYFRILSVSDKGTFEGNITIKSSADHFIYENNPFNLMCISSVNISNSKVRWIIHDKILTSDTNTVLQKTATTLYNGIFICQFYNDVLVSANGTFSITVIHQPVITAENQTFLCNTNTASVKLSCCAKSDNNSPVPPFYNVTFKFDNEELMGTQRENSISCFEVKKEFGCGKQTTVTCTFSSEYGNITPYKFEIKFIKGNSSS
ncbi:location of vulva defective 1-like [Protopterus annectens]|uniref:location of vulva defective 1-like n=1 Tax=Protopterus annectens TaxID=7888 RepID=UPI001CF97ECA|nr:location of vulva defective 1-like [Protopterus annectens]